MNKTLKLLFSVSRPEFLLKNMGSLIFGLVWGYDPVRGVYSGRARIYLGLTSDVDIPWAASTRSHSAGDGGGGSLPREELLPA